MNELEHKLNMKLVIFSVPQEQKDVCAIQGFENAYLFKSQRVQKNHIRVRSRKTCKGSLKLYPTKNLRYKQKEFLQISQRLKTHNNL